MAADPQKPHDAPENEDQQREGEKAQEEAARQREEEGGYQ